MAARVARDGDKCDWSEADEEVEDMESIEDPVESLSVSLEATNVLTEAREASRSGLSGKARVRL
jgi:hypothetical protein